MLMDTSPVIQFVEGWCDIVLIGRGVLKIEPETSYLKASQPLATS